MAVRDYRAYLARVVLLRPLRGPLGRALVGGIALLADSVAEGFRHAARAPWVGDDGIGPAYDALAPAGKEVSMPRYPGEAWSQYHARLKRAWNDWQFAGDELTLVAQLAAAGFPGAKVYTARQWSTRKHVGWWSQFWILFPEGTHTATAPGALIGSFTIGDGTLIGIVGITPDKLGTLRSIIRKWKPGRWICREIIFEISGWTIGDDVTIASGLVIGGEQATVGG